MFAIADRLQHHLGMALVALEKLLYNNSLGSVSLQLLRNTYGHLIPIVIRHNVMIPYHSHRKGKGSR